ncbi:MAG: hydratase [Curvibacter lanceolatus]|jgi:2-keto-4-pentenoate hydratase|uniref:2-keto-4-pentenoate hydratase n=1 Tax=Curvibacter lanceolatus TaxID=86182 RepID=UPI002357081C|nr:hydratase [Curvibacter lanceolatus]MBV5292615.1 hydratase [Curvibacter lanceolatus]
MTPAALAQALWQARQPGQPRVSGPVCDASTLPDAAAAYAVQDQSLRWLGPVGGWKVGAAGPTQNPTHTPICAPLPAAGLLASGVALSPPRGALRGLEVELALRVAHDLPPQQQGLGDALLCTVFDAVLPAIEWVDSRLAQGQASPALLRLADLQSHGALILGPARPLGPADPEPDLPTLGAMLCWNGQTVASTVGGNPAQDLRRLVDWLIGHTARRGLPLRGGQIVTTGSCTGLLWAPEAGVSVQGRLGSWGEVGLSLIS